MFENRNSLLTINPNNNGRRNDVSKSFADLNIRKLGDKKMSDSIPSDISEDEWAEVVKYD